MMALRFRPVPLRSPLRGVGDGAWTRLVRALDVQPARAISESGGFGSYDLRPRRLVELGRAKNLHSVRTPSGRQVYKCDLVLPLTQTRLLMDPLVQLEILTQSLSRYHAQLMSDELVLPKDASLAGVLAILHRSGRGALTGWPKLFPQTRALYEAAQGAF